MLEVPRFCRAMPLDRPVVSLTSSEVFKFAVPVAVLGGRCCPALARSVVRLFSAVAPHSRNGQVIVVSAGVVKSDPKMLSKPVMLKSSGMEKPAAWSSCMSPMASRSL